MQDKKKSHGKADACRGSLTKYCAKRAFLKQFLSYGTTPLAGLSWECVLNKRENFRAAFDGFDAQKVAAYGEEKKAELMQNKGIIRNRRKIDAAVVNCRAMLELRREFGSFERYVWSFTNGETVTEPWTERTTSPLSDAMSKDLKRRGMKFVGSTIIYSFLQAAGVINGHEEGCFCCEK